MISAERLQKKNEYAERLAIFLSQTTDLFIQIHIDQYEIAEAQVNGNKFQYSVWGDNNNGIFRDTLRALIREEYIDELRLQITTTGRQIRTTTTQGRGHT